MKEILNKNFNVFIIVVIFTVLFMIVPILFDKSIDMRTRIFDFMFNGVIWGLIGFIVLKVLRKIIS